jgi:hypothetical protein
MRRVALGLVLAFGSAGITLAGLASAASGTYSGTTSQIDPNPQTAYVITVIATATEILNVTSGENLTCKHASIDLPGAGNALSEIELTLTKPIPIRQEKFNSNATQAHDLVHIEGKLKGNTITGSFIDMNSGGDVPDDSCSSGKVAFMVKVAR